MRHLAQAGTHPRPTVPPLPADGGVGPAISPAARRWADLWKELDLTEGVLLDRAGHVKADRYGPHLELIPQLFDLRRGRRYISIGIKYDVGPGRHRNVASPAFGQFLNLAFADWAIADQLWRLLQTGDAGVSFSDLEGINGNFDRASKASDQYLKDRWVQAVWELKVRLEENARTRTLAALKRISDEIRSRPGAGAKLLDGGVDLPASLLGPDEASEAQTRFRINQGMYGDHKCFIDMPRDGRMRVHGIPPEHMLRRASELHDELTRNWLGQIGRAVDELVAITADREGAALALAIESAEVARKLNVVVETFWSMWSSPIFSANAEFEVVTDHERRAAKYMDIVVQRTLRILLKQAVEEIGFYPYASVDRFTYWSKVHGVKEALRRASHILRLYARADTLPAFKEANRRRNQLIRDFQANVMAQVKGRAAPPARA